MVILKKKKRLILFVVLFSLISFTGVRYWSSDFDTKIECIAYKFGDVTYENVVVRLVGSKNVSLFLKDYISYAVYIDDVRYPKENHLLMPHRTFSNNEISGNGTNYRKNFTAVNEIEERYTSYKTFYNVPISYRFWLDEVSASDRGFFNLGSLFFTKEYEDILITINQQNGDMHNWTNKIGYELIVSGNDFESAESTLKKFNMRVPNENESDDE
jgi:hypothetical protein